MTLFVRDNNNGKSCIMTLICELLKIQFHYKQYDFDEKPGNSVKESKLSQKREIDTKTRLTL